MNIFKTINLRVRKIRNIRIIFLLGLTMFNFSAQGQGKDSFHIYVLEKRYDENGEHFIKNNGLLKKIDLIGGYMIDPKERGLIDLESIKIYLNKLYPQADDEGVLCLNIENRLYNNLKKHDSGTKEFNEAILGLSKMVEYVKGYRPNLKVGIYGLPFRFYYPSQKTWDKGAKLDSLLSKTDYIFPSLYVLYPDKQKGIEANNKYWKENLDSAFDYADRLKKPVIPFIWYIVTIGNKKFGGELLGQNEMVRYLNFIKEYKSKNYNTVKGVVWWESSKNIFVENVKQASHLKENIELNSSKILSTYIGSFIRD
ncbi:MAG: hypothetical protein K0M40_00815 [Prolixibacteraceae bacterium]|nr:hypothetical protein [Prolixibacteraceae bacterium]